jgi:hypothetical protein
MGSNPNNEPHGQVGESGIIDRVAQAIGAAHEELWPVRRPHQPRLPSEVMYARAAAAALAVAREAVEAIEPPEEAVDDARWEEYRLAVRRALGGVE